MGTPQFTDGLGMLYRAVVAVPDKLAAGERYDERIVFFQSPTDADAANVIEDLLALAWGVDTYGWCEHGSIYNVTSAPDLAKQSDASQADTDYLYLLKTSWGPTVGVGTSGIGYARDHQVDLFVTPRHTKRLRAALARVEAKYQQADNLRK
jgi:hypothetical protein